MKKKTAVVIALVLILVLLVSVSQAASPGTSGDPLVSKSYVDDKFNQLLSILSGEPQSQVITTQSGEGAAYVPVNAAAGQIVLGGEGTEIILRSGRAVGYCVGENGMVDVTSGIEVLNNTEILPNHLLIVPRNDGRGVVITEDAWFIIKGGYTLQ